MAELHDTAFERLASSILDGLWFHHPDWASTLGLHEHDARLADRSAEGLAAQSAWLAERAAELAEVDFVEGWAVYAEEQMARHGYPGDGDPAAVRMQQLKMRLRMIINTVLDGRVHGHGMTEPEALSLMMDRGFQEDGEAAGKWRRTLLSSAQLSTYYVGYTEVADLVRDLRASHPDWTERQVHDAVLGHGSPAVRYLRELLAL